MGVLDILHEIQYKEWIAAREKEAKEGGKLSTKVYNSYYYIKEGKSISFSFNYNL